MTACLHFTFGPVQGFVAQARRTRDLYAGSLLLSHLAMQAMEALDPRAIVLPDLEALRKAARSEHALAPNRFIANFATDEEAIRAGEKATAAFRAAWERVATAVWEEFLVPAAPLGNATVEIWRRQCAGFWEISWVVGAPDEHDLLERRKNLRSLAENVEGGDHCTLMGNCQELSGYIRSQTPAEQQAFWKAVRGRVKRLDLEEDERLCAIAFIKRFYPLVAERAIGRPLDMQRWPSTVTIAALPWVRTISKTEANVQNSARQYADDAARHPGAVAGAWQRIRMLRELPQASGRLHELSGNFLNRTALANAADTPLGEEAQREVLLKKLRALENESGERAGNFFAMLLMDGDSMGALIGEHGAARVTVALTQFAQSAPDLVEKHDGVCIYAGGDDLLALLPLDRALDLACAAHALYADSFGDSIPATISGAIVFAHYQCTFSRVLRQAHTQLDEVAKDATGRDALALSVLKPGGITCQWSAPFAHLLDERPHRFEPLVKAFARGEAVSPGQLSASLLYNLRARFSELVRSDGGGGATLADREMLRALFTAEALIGRREHDPARAAAQRAAVEARMSQLLDVCELVTRESNIGALLRSGRFSFDAARLVKFLALDGKEGAE